MKEWSLARLIVNGGEVLVFLVLLLSPGIDLGMRFRILSYLLGIRTVFAAFRVIMKRKAEKEKKTVGMVLSLCVSILLFVCASIPSFLFADYEGLPTTGEYKVGSAQAVLVDDSREESFETDGSKREVPAYFFYPEGGDSGNKYPVIFFSHGAFGYYQSNMSTYMELASHGYVVVSLEHPYHALFTKDTDGKMILTDAEFMRDIQRINGSGVSEEQIFEVSSAWMELRLADGDFAVDTVKDAAQKQTLPECFFASGKDREKVAAAVSMMDCGKIGFMGHSLAGVKREISGGAFQRGGDHDFPQICAGSEKDAERRSIE